jgi:simple sugar transport system ATP-binding protein
MTLRESDTLREPVLRASGVTKHFGPVRALHDVSIEVFAGEVVALIGDNGAGKSTLVNVLTGVLTHDAGEMVFDGRAVRFSSPHEARSLGIETVYQDLAIAPHLDAVANIFLGREYVRPGLAGTLGFLDAERMERETKSQLGR